MEKKPSPMFEERKTEQQHLEPQAFETSRQTKEETLISIKKEKENLQTLKEEFTKKFEEELLIPITDLPSNFKLYPPNTSIYYKHYNLQDLEDLNNLDIRLEDQYRIMLSGIVCKGMNSRDITYHDFNAICVIRRLAAQGATSFRFPYTCNTCLNQSVHSFTLDNLDFEELTSELPIKVRFHTYPEEIFEFVPHTIGDILTLLDNRNYYRAIGNSLLTTNNGEAIVDTIAIFASCCSSHTWTDAYEKLIIAGENVKDRIIINQIDKALNHGIKPYKFKCNVNISEAKKHREEAEGLVDKVVNGELSLNTANEESKSPIPDFLKAFNQNICGAENYADVERRDILIPFCEDTESAEYGILT